METESQRKTIGILGGMGPEATARLFDLIVQKTRAEKDGDHIPVIIVSNPTIPDRTAAIMGRGISPLPLLVKTALLLEQAGADFLIMPCVTAHRYYPEIIKEINIPLIHMIQTTVRYLANNVPEPKSLGLLATSGTLETGLFQRELETEKLQFIVPDSGQQKRVMDAIYGKKGIKAGFKTPARQKLNRIADELRHRGARGLVAGCTEIALVADELDTDLPVVNPLRILASVAIQTAGYKEKKSD